MPILIPAVPAQAMEHLHQAGISAWAVGGAVRDSLLGRPASDWDITAACQPARLALALPEAKPIGGVYGTVSWHGVEITPCRAEADYTDHRHPDSVHFGGSLAQDLARRDFTVNAMAYDGKTLTDPYGGQQDLQAHLLRCVGDPEVRFTEDALRILRMFRFAGMLGFGIDGPSLMAALRLASTLSSISAPRVRGELEKALNGPHPSALAPLVLAGGLAAFGISGKSLAGRPEALDTLDRVPQVLLLRWWALLHLCGADAHTCAKVFDFGHAFCKAYEKLDFLFDAGCPQNRHALKLALLDPLPFSFADAADTFAAVSPAFLPLPGMLAALQASNEPYKKEQLAITPPELLVEGVPGRKIGRVQHCLLKAVIDTPEMNVYPTLAQMAKSLARVIR